MSIQQQQETDVVRIIEASKFRFSVPEWDEIKRMLSRAWLDGYTTRHLEAGGGLILKGEDRPNIPEPTVEG